MYLVLKMIYYNLSLIHYRLATSSTQPIFWKSKPILCGRYVAIVTPKMSRIASKYSTDVTFLCQKYDIHHQCAPNVQK